MSGILAVIGGAVYLALLGWFIMGKLDRFRDSGGFRAAREEESGWNCAAAEPSRETADCFSDSLAAMCGAKETWEAEAACTPEERGACRVQS